MKIEILGGRTTWTTQIAPVRATTPQPAAAWISVAWRRLVGLMSLVKFEAPAIVFDAFQPKPSEGNIVWCLEFSFFCKKAITKIQDPPPSINTLPPVNTRKTLTIKLIYDVFFRVNWRNDPYGCMKIALTPIFFF